MKTYSILAAAILCVFTHAYGQAPANDDFANAQVITDGAGTVSGGNTDATLETGEPTTTSGFPSGRSVWFEWTAPATGPFTFGLTADFDSQLAIYTGAAADSLTLRGEDDRGGDGFGGGGGESIDLPTTAGTVFQIRVTGYEGESGSFSLAWEASDPVYESLFSFTEARAKASEVSGNKGTHPTVGLVQGADGNFYGTTELGGEFGREGFGEGFGTAFKITPAGVLTTLVQFTGDGLANKGSRPSSLMLASDGNFYGTTKEGGAADHGTVFQMTRTGVLTTLVEFTGTGGDFKGSRPTGALIEQDGGFIGMTNLGGADNLGTIFFVVPDGEFFTDVEFTGNGSVNKGGNPTAGLIQGANGDFYGTTSTGGAFGNGTVFKIPADDFVLETLVEFTGTAGDNIGRGPSSLLLGSDGELYGTTEFGGTFLGSSGLGNGTVFKMTPAGVLTTLVEFTGSGPSDNGIYPSSLLQAVDGDFYGTTRNTVFKLTTAGGLATLAEFTSQLSSLTLIQASNGNFYGTTAGQGIGEATEDSNGSTVFKMTPSGEVTILEDFGSKGAGDIGKWPEAGLIQGSDGDFYGTTVAGGEFGNDEALAENGYPHGRGYGTVFKINSAGELTTLVEFTSDGAANKGRNPIAGLVQGADGDFYGTTASGGSESVDINIPGSGGGQDFAIGHGTIFKMTPAGVLTTLVEFTGDGPSNKGTFPSAALIQGNDGNFYGTTEYGGASDRGTVFKMTPAGVLTTLVEFTEWASPRGALVQVVGGDFYGTTAYSGSAANNPDGFGTVFKMSTDGEPSGTMLTTLVEFTNNGTDNKGSRPSASLLEASDGNFYSTTAGGGALGFGTVFKMTPTGVLTTLAEFPTVMSGHHSPNRNHAGLLEGSNGLFYGTTPYGGQSGSGTVFKMDPAGDLTTILEFSDELQPRGTLIQGVDGAIYGTTIGILDFFSTEVVEGSVFRLVFPGTAYVSLLNPQVQGTSTALIQATVNPVGISTSVILEYGTDGVTFPNDRIVQPNFTGFQSILVGRTIEGLTLGTTYYYRFRAVSITGETVSEVASFSTLGQPLVTATAATEIGPTSARFHGTVNPRNYESTVSFQWGTDGNTFPNEVPVDQGRINGGNFVPVSASVVGLVQGVTYYYRVVGINIGGTGISGSQNFRTLADPTATLGEPTGITSQSATLNGTVNAKGSATAVIFEYGTDGVTFDSSIGATPSSVTGDQPTAVSANLSGLTQGETYHYRIRATSSGGVGVSSSGTLALDILSGFVQIFPDAPPEAQGFVFVTLLPSGVGGWRFEGEQLWRGSGIPVGGLATGDRVIEFRPIPGFLQPPPETVGVISGGAATFLERVYYETSTSGTGGITVTLKPEALAAASVPELERAQWRLLGDDDSQWRDSETTLGNLVSGNYLIECKPVAGRTTPPASTVFVSDAQTATLTITYSITDSVNGTLPSLIPFESVSTDQSKPYAYVGQIRSSIGASSGFVVKSRVVATAGHVVFDDGTLSAVIGLQWLFQRHSGSNEPKPQIPRGFYNFDGYAAQREAENTPGSSSPASQNLDVAAIYFLEDAARGGVAGFLASDALENEFLLSSADKMLVGFPVDGISPLNQGKMHATPPANVTFTRAFERTYTTSEIRSSGGASGGPICVQFENGNYYPAAIYLGGTGQTVVRAIDSPVIDLFNRADVSANGGDNNTGGGITHTSVAGNLNTSQAGAIRIIIEPAEARAVGAAWQLNPETSFRQSSSQKSGLSAGTYNLNLNTVPGFFAPPISSVVVFGGQLTTVTFTYLADHSPLDLWRFDNFATYVNTGDAADGEDPDKDGVKNIDEFTAGTSPNSATDFLKVATTAKSGSTFTVGCAGKAGRIYTLQRNLTLGGTWTAVGTQTTLDDDGPVSLTDPAAPADAAYYRIEVSLQE